MDKIRKKYPYQLTTVDGTPSSLDNSMVNFESDDLWIQISEHREETYLDVTQLAGEDIILGLS